MTWLAILKVLLRLVAYFARRAERADTEKAALDALQNLHRARVDRAADARDDVLSGRVPERDDDPYRRD